MTIREAMDAAITEAERAHVEMRRAWEAEVVAAGKLPFDESNAALAAHAERIKGMREMRVIVEKVLEQ